MTRSFRTPLLTFTALGLALTVSGCMMVRDSYDVPTVDLPSQFYNAPNVLDGERLAAGHATDTQSKGYRIPLPQALPTWWQLFENPELNQLVDRALTRNPDLRVASLRVSQAEARYEQAFAAQIPTVTTPIRGQASAPKDGTGSVLPGRDVTSERTFSASIQVNQRLDIWGERKAASDAAKYRVWQALLTRDDTQKTTVSTLVGTYIDYLSFNDRLRIADQTQKTLTEMLRTVQDRMDRGDATVLDVNQQLAAVRAVQATIPALRLQAAQAAHRIAQLCGTTPSQLHLSDRGLDSIHLPMVLPGVPSSLLLRRSDVRAAEANLLAADADIDLARARILPSMDLSAEIGKASNYMVTWFQPESLLWSLVSSISATIFDSGARQQAVEQNKARYEELTETYISTLYTAARESEDALARLSFGAERQQLQQAATDAALEAVLQSRDSYRYGATAYQTLLDTERTLHTTQDQLYQVIRDRYRGAVDVFDALGGGVEIADRLPGQGKRPDDDLKDKDSGQVVLEQAPALPAPAPETLQTGDAAPLGADLTAPAAPQAAAGPWRVILPAIYSQSGLTVAWRDLQNQFANSLQGLALYPTPLQDGATALGDGSAALSRQWYRLSIGPFTDKETAQDLCKTLSKGGNRCSVGKAP